MKEFRVKYRVYGDGYIRLMAENYKDAENEVYNVLCGNEPRHEENAWLDEDTLYDVEYNSEIIESHEV